MNDYCSLVIRQIPKREMEIITQKAKDAGLSREHFCREVLMGAQIQQAPPADFFTLITEVKRTGSNINQLLKMARINGFLSSTDLQSALKHNFETEQMLWDVFLPVR